MSPELAIHGRLPVNSRSRFGFLPSPSFSGFSPMLAGALGGVQTAAVFTCGRGLGPARPFPDAARRLQPRGQRSGRRLARQGDRPAARTAAAIARPAAAAPAGGPPLRAPSPRPPALRFIRGAAGGGPLTRLRYWKLSAGDLDGLSYPADRVLNWDIKCVRPPEDEARFVGVFMYRNGTPVDYTPVKGVAYYHNNIPREELPAITRFLRGRFGGREEEKGERIILRGSSEIYGAGEIAELARALEAELGAAATITLEFGGMTEDEAKEAGLPEAKLLPVPTK